jgi:hypothetical protein
MKVKDYENDKGVPFDRFEGVFETIYTAAYFPALVYITTYIGSSQEQKIMSSLARSLDCFAPYSLLIKLIYLIV